ncbi:hypothetical protein [Spirosoma endophyticum]|uniref:Por secretion system C-terminal sorting domain-containing protein n=1 Tax=Spirosoma endophyticum TaxID=662367 RepID=A0A1I1W664_9BACT|nr:hypothetical protein [Spirosoma endophyticum]SFD90604.1 Por secretion system C-terminal sorting domain-containing protein [Spirosoma endophyticum]
MKTFIKPLLVAFTLSFVTLSASFAETNPIGRTTGVASYKTGIYTTIEGKLNVAVNKETGGAVDIRLKKADGKVVYTQHLGKNETAYRVRLSLDELEDGVYQLEITNGVETTTQNVTVATKQPTTPSRIVAVN